MVPTSPGTVLDDRYELLRRLGSGGTASVFAARDLLANTEVAVKVLHPELRLQEKNLARFEPGAPGLGRRTWYASLLDRDVRRLHLALATRAPAEPRTRFPSKNQRG